MTEAMKAMTHQTEFDFRRGKARGENGMQRANESRAELLAIARYLAVEIASYRPDRAITADDVQRALIRRGYTPDQLGNAAGSIFRGKEWEFTGEWRPSERVSNHGHQNRVWRLKT